MKKDHNHNDKEIKFEDDNLDRIKSSVFHRNLFKINLKPKRNSCDVRNFMQVYRKKCRTLVIDKQLQQSMEKFIFPENGNYHGFKGSRLTIKYNKNFSLNKNKQRLLKTQQDLSNTCRTNMEDSFSKDKSKSSQIKYKTIGLEQIKLQVKEMKHKRKYNKPNMMYNMSLYKNRAKVWAKLNNSENQLSFVNTAR